MERRDTRLRKQHISEHAASSRHATLAANKSMRDYQSCLEALLYTSSRRPRSRHFLPAVTDICCKLTCSRAQHSLRCTASRCRA
jgi:hypothetical protein